MSKGVLVLGATGSIGKSTRSILSALPDKFHVVGLVARNNIEELAVQATELHPQWVITTDPELEQKLTNLIPDNCRAASGMAKVVELAASPEVDIVLCAIVGTAGLEPVVAAIRAGKRIALASKEVLVLAGEIINREIEANPQSEIIPVDSEHSAIFQCLAGRKISEVKNLYLTASGGAFREWTRDEIAQATLNDALAHPTWDMGEKVTIDSASMMNKALEMVEAHHLFGVRPEQIKVLIHPQSIVHSMVELSDSSFIAQMSKPDMRFAISYALTYPERVATALPELGFSTRLGLDFQLPDRNKYPAFDFAYEAMKRGGTMPGVMNAANEVAVERFRRGEIKFPAIWKIIEKTMNVHTVEAQSSFEIIRAADAWARNFAREIK
ncbi:MAG: 1-deoxy-D-xylulose-5-phosphate reductoisomerase [Victivallales bacterium]|jgi:1-deoxy-D-xylulose-5-phosphate reductoisomerase|nr:1-deoxy-D-xylulose-5-phosphate reductoisomerase [Victivallales bacterium]